MEIPTQPIESSKQKGKLHVPAYPESDPLLLDSSLSESNSLTDSSYSKSKSKKCNKNKKHQKHKKQDLSESLSSDSDSSDNSDYRRKRRKNNKIHLEKGSYQIMYKVTGKISDKSL